MTTNPAWSPRTQPVTRDDLDASPILVVHYWAAWDLHDREMDARLAATRDNYDGRIGFRSCDIDRAENQPFIHGIATIPALGCFIRGTWHQSLIGLRSVEDLRVVFVSWMAAADACAARRDNDAESHAMPETRVPNPVLPDASVPSPPSRYAFASLAVSVLALVWLGLAILSGPLPFGPYKQHRIGSVASVLALILAVAAYRQPAAKRSLTHVAIAAASLSVLAYVLLAPI